MTEIPPKHKTKYTHVIIVVMATKEKNCFEFYKTCDNCKNKGHYTKMCTLKKYMKKEVCF